jgi:hypothetical protein
MEGETNKNGNGNGNVKWTVFVWTIGVILLLFSIGFGTVASYGSQTEKMKEDITDIKVFMGRADITFSNLDKTLLEIKVAINK